MNLENKIVVITGATGGIGSVLAKQMSEKGCRLILLARTQEKLDNLKKLIKENDHLVFSADFTSIDDLSKVIEKIKGSVDHVDILINAAGVGIYKGVEEVEIKQWIDSMAINATAPFYLIKELLPLLKVPEKSVVINIGSGMGKIPTACRSVYCATKYALRGMTLSLAEEFSRTNIKFVHIALGSTLTEFGPLTLQDKIEENLQGKSYLTPESVAQKFIHIIENDEFEEEISVYPSDYNENEDGQ